VWVGGIDSTQFETGELYSSISEIIIHPDYNNVTLQNDIALLKLASPVQQFSKL